MQSSAQRSGPRCLDRYTRAGEEGAAALLAADRRIDALFDIERDINGLTADERLAVRRYRNSLLLGELETRLRAERAKVSRSGSVVRPVD